MPSSLLEKKWTYLSEGDLYMDPGRWDRRHAMDERKKQTSTHAFKPVAPPRESFGIFPHAFENEAGQVRALLCRSLVITPTPWAALLGHPILDVRGRIS